MATPAQTDTSALAGTAGKRSLGQLVSDVSLDVSQIMRGELELAKTEIMQDVSHAGKGAGMFAGAALFGLYGLGLLWLGLAGVIGIWLGWWAGLLIMAGVLFLIAAVLGLIGNSQRQKVNGKPERAIREAKETVDTVKSAAQGQRRASALETSQH
ncbi:MAG: phage holin family protein [Arsenicicoccus sp.]|nr:MAG: phage holin family protein [Arsenicicoccus sp.]